MKVRPMILAMLWLLPGPAPADEGDLPLRTSGLYLGAAAGISDLQAKFGPAKLSGTDFGYKLFAGYRFPRSFLPWGANIALEGAYVQLGDIYDQSLGSDFNLAIDGFDISAVGILPVAGRWEVFGKLGAYFSDTQVTEFGTVVGTDSSTDLSLGFGLAYQTGSPFSVAVELNGYGVADGAWLASVSGAYQFK